MHYRVALDGNDRGRGGKLGPQVGRERMRKCGDGHWQDARVIMVNCSGVLELAFAR
jgi:hypothetical protein